MALPTIDNTVVETVEAQEVQAKREAAVAAVAGESTANAVVAAPVTQSATNAASNAIATASHVAGGANPADFLAELGITDLKLDFTSFPCVTLNDGSFSTDEHKKFATEFECVYVDKRSTYLFRTIPKTRDEEPKLVYSDDGITCNKDGEPIAAIIEQWKSEGYEYERKPYIMVLVSMVSEPYEGELVQLQISPASQGKLGGYLTQLGIKRLNPRDVVTKVSVGAEVGSGVKAFNPWKFSLVK